MVTVEKSEKAKLKANYLNSVSIGLTLSGLAPFLVAVQHVNGLADHIENGRAFRFPDLGIGIGTALAIGMAIYGGVRFHRAAIRALDTLAEQNSN